MVAKTVHGWVSFRSIKCHKNCEKSEFLITHGSSILVEINDKRAKFNFPTKTKGEMHWSEILEGGPEQVGEMITCASG
jgi:hypothetical protein